MNSRPELRLDWCTHEAAKYACEKWHYSKCMPSGKIAKIGVWESGRFVGVLLYSSGATQQIGMPYKLKQTEICELTRIALAQHENHVSKIMAVSLRMMRKWYKGLRMIVSYSDLNQGHIGGIYQAANWIYVGMARDSAGSLILNGVATHGRSVVAKYGTRNLEWIRTHVDPRARHAETAGKHKYLMPLDDEIRQRIEPLRKPYPKRVRSEDSGTADNQSAGGGANPTRALQPVSR